MGYSITVYPEKFQDGTYMWVVNDLTEGEDVESGFATTLNAAFANARLLVEDLYRIQKQCEVECN